MTQHTQKTQTRTLCGTAKDKGQARKKSVAFELPPLCPSIPISQIPIYVYIYIRTRCFNLGALRRGFNFQLQGGGGGG
jgi:hypothetical protein